MNNTVCIGVCFVLVVLISGCIQSDESPPQQTNYPSVSELNSCYQEQDLILLGRCFATLASKYNNVEICQEVSNANVFEYEITPVADNVISNCQERYKYLKSQAITKQEIPWIKNKTFTNNGITIELNQAYYDKGMTEKSYVSGINSVNLVYYWVDFKIINSGNNILYFNPCSSLPCANYVYIHSSNRTKEDYFANIDPIGYQLWINGEIENPRFHDLVSGESIRHMGYFLGEYANDPVVDIDLVEFGYTKDAREIYSFTLK